MTLPRILADTGIMTSRNVRRIMRTPQLVAFSTVQPVMFVLLFVYVFGGAINTPGFSYVDYLIPGILVQTVLFGGAATSVGLAQDLNDGIVDRFRALPMARSAVLTGRTIADASRNVFVVGLMLVVGTLVGFRFHGPPLDCFLALVLVMLFGYAFSWVFVSVALAVRDPETAQVAGFLPIFPLVFASSAFVPVATMPSWLQPFAKHQPVTATVNAVRALTQGLDIGTLPLQSLAWSVGIIAIGAPLAVARYRRLS